MTNRKTNKQSYLYFPCKYPPFLDKPKDPQSSGQPFSCSNCDSTIDDFIHCTTLALYNKREVSDVSCYFSFDESYILKDDNSQAMSQRFEYKSKNFEKNLGELNKERRNRKDCTEPNWPPYFLIKRSSY